QGRTRGLPTANVPFASGLARPAPGVYAGRLCAGPATWPAGVFVPDPGDPRQALFGGVLEAHAVGANTGDLYGRSVRVLFGPRIRGFRAYSSPADEAAGIRADLQEVLRENERFDWSEH
ncbi:MAG: hypothetical protein IK066_10385, partial [Kiritimatiellae bacterium]|nr:hypothetical protein [Kiritimatiellia bacterium]